MYERAKYRSSDEKDWRDIPDPVGTIKYDGANYFMPVETDGSLRFFSRRESVKGGFPERTAQLPHLTSTKLPEYAGNIYNVELIHTGHSPNDVDSHRAVSGILNSLPERSIATQKEQGPVRVILHNVVSPELPTYKDKLGHLKKVEESFGNPAYLRLATPFFGHNDINKLIEHTKLRGHEGVIIASATKPEAENYRVKIKHIMTYNLLVSGIEREYDIKGNPKNSAGALVLMDATGRVVGRVGTGFTRSQREDIWKEQDKWIGKLIQVKTMGLAKDNLRMPVYNGDADGQVDIVQ